MVKSAYYGSDRHFIDVTSRIQQDIFLKKSIIVSNGYFGSDPCPGTIKKLKVTLENDKQYIYTENSLCYFQTLSETFYTKDRIGIFYTNNKINQAVLNKSLETIFKAKEYSTKTEIIICSQSSCHQSYFLEIDSLFKSNHHANIATQVLQALNAVKNYNNFKYVSFLEHDVLYPQDYFNYADFDVDCVCNDNYIGLNRHGFQQKTQNDQPLHQMTMKYSYAVSFFEKLVLTYLKGDFELLEPSIKHRHNNPTPSVHVNHGRHLTSHFNIYSKTTSAEDAYWGNAEQYSNLFL